MQGILFLFTIATVLFGVLSSASANMGRLARPVKIAPSSLGQLKVGSASGGLQLSLHTPISTELSLPHEVALTQNVPLEAVASPHTIAHSIAMPYMPQAISVKSAKPVETRTQAQAASGPGFKSTEQAAQAVKPTSPENSGQQALRLNALFDGRMLAQDDSDPVFTGGDFSETPSPTGNNRLQRALAPVQRMWGRLFPNPEPRPGDAHWEKIGPAVRDEIAMLNGLAGKAERQEYLRNEGTAIVERIKKHHGSSELGFHFNLHGGAAEQYIKGGGIRATRGDIALQHTAYPTASMLAHKVYFFRDQVNLFDILNEGHPQMMFMPSRMGHVFMVFRLDSPYLKRAFAEGGATEAGAISIDFDEAWIAKNNKGRPVGIPYDTFLAPPMSVFTRVKRHLGLRRLSRDAETLAVMRYIESTLTASE
jgi:hypothetical protein